MSNEELTIADVLADQTKDFRTVFHENEHDDEDEPESVSLHDNQYYTDTEFNELITNSSFTDLNHVIILSINIANLFSKLSSLNRFLTHVSVSGKKPDIVCLVETHISHEQNAGYDKLALSNIVPGYKFFHKGRSSRKGGGVGILVSDDIQCEADICEASQRKVAFVDEQFENIVVRIPECIDSTNSSRKKKDLVIAAVYRQPNSSNLEVFLNHTETLLRTIDKPGSEIVIAGDMNLDLLKYESHLPTSRYLDIMTNHGLIPRIIRPTRIKNQSASLIDHIFTRNNILTEISGILDTELAGSSGYTDHKPIFSVLRARLPKKDKKASITISYFTVEGERNRREGLLNENWTDVYNESNPDLIYDKLIHKYGFHYTNNLTTKVIRPGSNRTKREPWMTNEILSDIRKRDRLAKIKGRRQDYKRLRNSIVSRCRKAEREYLAKQVQESVGDIKRHWNILKKVMNKTNNKTEITTKFSYNGRGIENDRENADNFNTYYAQIGKHTNESVGAAKFMPEHYLHRHRQRNEQSLLINNFTPDEVAQACSNLSKKSSQGPHGFKQNVVLNDAEIIAPVLAHLVNSSLSEGICPRNSKIARVTPVYKQKGSKHQYDNYRPISLLSAFSKIMEKLIYDKIFEFLIRHEILFESQFGFRKGHNTTHATLDFIKNVEEALDNGEIAIGVFCDLSKAFDTLDHDVLLLKLNHYGIRGKLNDWFSSYLQGRQQFVDWKGSHSARECIFTGVPQGSILGPLLFLIYINDLPSASNLKCTLYADDSNLLTRGKEIEQTAFELNTQLERISDYFKANKLKLNAKKTKLVCFRKKSQSIDLKNISVYLDGEKLEFEEETVFLGITIDSHLDWGNHCQKVANRISLNCGVLNRVKKQLPPASLKTLYSSLILPHLQYGLAAWGGCSSQAKKRITMIQKRAIRTICKAYHTSHTEPRMRQLGLLKLDDLYKQQCLTFINDSINKRGPISVANMIVTERESTTHNLRNHHSDPNCLRVPLAKSRYISNSFSFKGPQMWNQLPNDLKVIERKSLFKIRLKQHFLMQYNETTHCCNPRCTDRRHHLH